MPIPTTSAPGPLDVALSLVLHRALPFASRKQHDLLRRRLGWGPAPPLSQKETALALGLSPQRIAQLERRVLDVLAATGPPPSVERSLEVLSAMAPCESSDAAVALYAERVTVEVIHPSGVLVAAQAAGAAVDVEVIRLDERRTAVVAIGGAARRADFAAQARQHVAALGVRRIGQVTDQGSPGDLEVEAALRHAGRVGRTDDVLWWRDDTASPVVRPLQRMMAALGPLPTNSLAAGIARAWRYTRPAAVPDAEALEAYLTGQQAYRRQDDGRWSLCARATEHMLLPEDRAVLDLIRGSPHAESPRSAIVLAMTAASYSPNSMTLLIATSPLLERVQHGRYKLRH